MALDWNEDPGGEPDRVGDKRFGYCDEEARHELRAAIHFYPLLENAIRAGLKRDVPSHMRRWAGCSSGWRGRARQSAGDAARRLQRRAAGDDLRRQSLDLLPLPAPDERQRDHRPGGGRADHLGRQGARMGHPAGALGVPAWLRRRHRHLGRVGARPARRLARHQRLRRLALDMAGKTLADVSAFDLYSCFPSAVEVAMKEIGISRGRSAADQRHRRPALLRRSRQQLRHPLDRRDDERGAQQARLVRHGDGQRHLPHQALRRPLFDRADRRARGGARIRRSCRPSSMPGPSGG